jgi:hypothetical protein
MSLRLATPRLNRSLVRASKVTPEWIVLADPHTTVFFDDVLTHVPDGSSTQVFLIICYDKWGLLF